MDTTTTSNLAPDHRRCGCCGHARTRLAEVGTTPGVFICRRCALWAFRRAGPHAEATTTQGASGVSEVASTDRRVIHDEMDQASALFRQLVSTATKDDLSRLSAGTRWINQQLLFHMLFGYLIVLRLLPLVRLFGRLPDGASRVFAAVLNSATRPFHVVNYLGSYGGGTVITPVRMVAWLDRIVQALHRRLDAEDDISLQRTMHFPVGWDPFFTETMTLADVFHFGTQHFDYHQAQLTLVVPEA